jgi:hypothetical protein
MPRLGTRSIDHCAFVSGPKPEQGAASEHRWGPILAVELRNGCYVNCYVTGELQPVSRRVRASCKCETGDKIGRFELVSSYLNARQVLKTGDKTVLKNKSRKKVSCYEEGYFRRTKPLRTKPESRGDTHALQQWVQSVISILPPLNAHS